MSSVSPVADSAQPTTVARRRIVSVDALRGFDMLWITGAAALVRALDKMNLNDFTKALATQLTHCQWEGFRFYDLIFPLFLFLIGVSLVFSLDHAIASDDKLAAIKRIFRRSLLLYLLGVFHSGGLTEPWPMVQLAGVLHRIAACYFFAAIIYVCFSTGPKVMAAIAVLLLVGYWALLTFVPFPDIKLTKENVTEIAEQIGTDSPAAIRDAVTGRISGVYEEGRNLTNFTDFLYLPGKKTQVYYINEGLLSTIPAIAICLFGVFAGRLLKNTSVEPKRKVLLLCAGGIALILVGLLWSIQFPLIKRIWSSSFCLVASGCSALLLALFYLIIDVWRYQKWCQPFIWIGMNSITIYLAVNIIDFKKLAERFVGGDIKAFFDANVAAGFGQLVAAILSLIFAVLLCRFLYVKKIFLRV